MKKNSCRNLYKDAIGAMFLLACAFFVGSTLLSMRAVLADPIAPVDSGATNAQNMMSSRQSANRANPRANGRTTNTARPTTTANASARGVASRNVASRTSTNSGNTNTARSVVARTAARTSAANRTTATRGTSTRNVRSRNSGTTMARISATGDVIRGSKTTNSTYYTYLSNKLYTGNYSNIIDSTTGLISADAYSNCLESYYTCMDEICTARNEAQRRCACAGRVKAFAAAEAALESANEELIKVSGELALLVANKGKDVSSAFTLTEAEQVMNCVSWKEVTDKYGTNSEQAIEWCNSHGIYKTTSGSDLTTCAKPSYCTSGDNGNNFGFNVDDMNGTSSDILASLAKWADEVQTNTNTILKDTDNSVLATSLTNMANVTSGLFGISDVIDTDTVEDTLAETWGYDLFQYAHNNVCARVLDSCFNGIYEACGTPPSGGRCANGATSSCPYNYNSKVTISSSGDVTLNERSTTSANSSASCFGYTSTSSDPYSSLRGPVADARRSVMQKYLLDANADCDAYGEQLKTTAQKITYQKVAAQQALQQKRLDFYNEEQNQILSDAISAGTNFNECISELLDCYETQERYNTTWSTARIKNYCAQIANAPHCYETMVCNPSYAQFRAIIDKPDAANCTWDASDYTKNTCRNVVTLNEILNKAADSASLPGTSNNDSAKIREKCLQEALGCGTDSANDCIRNWSRAD